MIRRLRRWWCCREHDKGYRLHDWELVGDGKGSIRCRRCGHFREGFAIDWSKFRIPGVPDLPEVDPDVEMADRLASFRTEHGDMTR